MTNYRFTFGYLALKMLGKTLYSNPFAALSELIANGFDAKADSVWAYIDIRHKENAEIVVIDNGSGMSDTTVIDKYLQVGKKNRPDTDKEMMGRKGIGKLAAFYLSNKYYLITKTKEENNVYEIDFTHHEDGTKSEDDDTYMTKIDSVSFPNQDIYEKNLTGTALYMTNVNFVGYGEKTFSVLEGELAELFSLSSKKIYLKIINNDEALDKDFVLVRKKIAFKNMAKIYYNLNDEVFKDVIALNGIKIKNAEMKSKDETVKINVERYTSKPDSAVVNGKEIDINPVGWIGIHQTINREKAHENDPDNFIKSKFYHFNKIRIYVRGKLALENILPYVHNTQYYSNYIEGEINCDELDDNRFPDIASSSRQDIDKNDDRFIKLVKFVKEIVNALVNFKDNQTKKDDDKKRTQQKNAVRTLSSDVDRALRSRKGKPIGDRDIEEINHTITNSFEHVRDLVKTEYVVFLSHRRIDRKISDFLYNYLISVCGFDSSAIFYTSKSGGPDESVSVLEQQINETLTSKNTYVVFCIESPNFMESQFCMFEGGAAWAVKQKDVIGLIYNNYDNYVPDYLKNMHKLKVDFSNPQINRDLYISIANLLNSLIEYLNRNYLNEADKKSFIDVNIPNDYELSIQGENIEEFYNAKVVGYWNYYVLGKRSGASQDNV